MKTFLLLGAFAVLVVQGVVAVGSPALAGDSPPLTLSPTEARTKVGQKVTVQMTVRSAKDRLEKRGEIYLDSELDFRGDKNFAAVITREGAGLFQNQDIRDFEEHFRNKTIRVQGTVSVVDEVPRIEVSDPAQIELLKTP